MKNRTFKTVWLPAVLASVLALTACGADGSKTQQTKEGEAPAANEPKPVELFFYTDVTDEVFQATWGEHIRQKFPHVTVKHQQGVKGSRIEDLVAAGTIPDVMRTQTTTIRNEYLGLGLSYDMRELVQKNKLDLDRFNPVYMQRIINETGAAGGEIYGLPINSPSPLVLFYNKDLFDKFGVPYPKDGMSWDDLLPLTQQLSRSEGGILYRGLTTNYMSVLRDNAWSLPILNPNADEMADVAKWQILFNNLKRLYEVPNNTIAATLNDELQVFYKQRTAAMYVGQINQFNSFPADLNWDMVSYPQLKETSNKLSQLTPPYWSITRQSKHKDEAFTVILDLLSEDLQLAQAKEGKIPTLADKKIEQAFGQTTPALKGKNTKAVFYYPFADPTPLRKAELPFVPLGTQQTILSGAFEKVVKQRIDVNTALRDAQELLKKELNTAKSK
ncbi:ABC transporter substrate-binding protein [Paenibacillus ginsengarvi]|uniref:Extracellular solute-binding protein n=1 Tax=Paenibacillus ginsengarvi TaxID=400777 RepID=A0A3B0BPD1_9BACL|nr:extracellular solute-binding protein [Paenibacillus ginsengarvi]RKN74198.1 extracellular solute-binding protein [Paenibacillus ginsengarvi]